MPSRSMLSLPHHLNNPPHSVPQLRTRRRQRRQLVSQLRRLPSPHLAKQTFHAQRFHAGRAELGIPNEGATAGYEARLPKMRA
jgi:hypothetical protein